MISQRTCVDRIDIALWQLRLPSAAKSAAGAR
jgi:hypothetical protein